MTVESADRDAGIAGGGGYGRFAAKQLSKVVPDIAVGTLVVELPTGVRIERFGTMSGPQVSISVHRWRALIRLVFGGEVGFAASYLSFSARP